MTYVIQGNYPLEGTIKINGSKNASFSIIVGAILAKDTVVLKNIPNISDVHDLIETLTYLNCKVNYDGYTLTIDSTQIVYKPLYIPTVKKLRASYYFMGAMLCLFQKAEIYKPGGCDFGSRPIDIHLNGFEKMNVEVLEKEDKVMLCAKEKIKPCKLNLSFPSVGATINLILASLKINGVTIINNVAKEPEIDDFIDFLNKMGAQIDKKLDSIIIKGSSKLHGCEYTIMSDRIECGTYLIYAAALAKKVKLTNMISSHIQSLISIFKQIGIKMDVKENEVTIYESTQIHPIKVITGPYPDFPTDLQQILSVLLLKANGDSVIIDTIYEKRLSHIEELKKLNAQINIVDKNVIISKSDNLIPELVYCKDLRGGAGLLLACLMTKGISTLKNTHLIERGYQNIVECLTNIGAKIERRED